jgi:hypothetical protein
MSDSEQLNPACLRADPDLAGTGVRAAVYAQNFVALITAVFVISRGKTKVVERAAAEQSSLVLIATFALLVSAFVQAKTTGTSTYHAIIVLNLSWINSTITLRYLPLFTKEDLQRKHNNRVASWKTSAWTSPLFIMGSLQLSVLSAFGLWFWATVDTFASARVQCAPQLPISIPILNHTTRANSSGIRIASIVLYAFMALPGFNVWFFDKVITLLVNPLTFISLAFLNIFLGGKHLRATVTYGNVYFTFLVAINVAITIDTELMVRQAAPALQSGESQWTFGATLALFVLALPWVRSPRRHSSPKENTLQSRVAEQDPARSSYP